MRGYISFLLVLCVLACIFAFLAAFPALHSTSGARAISAERTNAISMNVKEAMMESTSYWLRASALAYDALPDPDKDPVDREKAIKAGILAGWGILAAHAQDFSPDFQVEFWCGYINPDTKMQLSREMMNLGYAKTCKNCSLIYSQDCADFIQVAQKEFPTDGKPPTGSDKVYLKGSFPITLTDFGAVGASIYSPKYNTSNVIYIPLDQVIQ